MDRGRIWINNHFMDEVEQLARAATQDSWWWARFEAETHEEMVQFVATGLAGSDSTRLNVIAVGDEGQPDYRMIAYTGNGPTSAANSKYVMAVQPRSVLTLIAYVRDLQEALRVHTENDNDLLSCPSCDWDIESYGVQGGGSVVLSVSPEGSEGSEAFSMLFSFTRTPWQNDLETAPNPSGASVSAGVSWLPDAPRRVSEEFVPPEGFVHSSSGNRPMP